MINVYFMFKDSKNTIWVVFGRAKRTIIFFKALTSFKSSPLIIGFLSQQVDRRRCTSDPRFAAGEVLRLRRRLGTFTFVRGFFKGLFYILYHSQ